MKTILLTIVLCLGLSATATAYEMDRIVAVVNDDVIVMSELEHEIALILNQLQARGTRLPPRPVLERQVLERMIDKRLQLQAAQRLGIKVDEDTVTRAVSNIAERNHVSLGELRDALEAEGMSFAAFREDTRNQILLARLRSQEVVNRIVVTDREVERFIERHQGGLTDRDQVHLQHILLAIPEGAGPERIQRTRAEAERLVTVLRGGADFAETALVHSDGRQALEGGDLGWMKLTEVPSIAADVARTLNTGEISDPIRSTSGFHIFRMAEVKGGERQLVTQTHARHILIKTDELISDQEARGRLQQLRIRLEGGEDFSSIARSHSDDTASAIKGGDLGWVNPGDTVPDFQHRMDALAPGEISQPFSTPYGWHMVQVLERRTHDSTDDMLRAKARETLRQRKADEETELWLRRLRDEAYVELHLDDGAGL